MNNLINKLCNFIKQILNPIVIQERSLEVSISPSDGPLDLDLIYSIDDQTLPVKSLNEGDVANDISYILMVESGQRIGEVPTERIYASVKTRHNAKFKERVESNGVATIWTIWIQYTGQVK